MKRIFLLLALFFAIALQASTYKYLTFTNTSGQIISFTVENLHLEILNDTQLHISNNDCSLSLRLIDLSSMQFTENGTTALDNVLNADAPIQVFTLTGASLGTFKSLIHAGMSLSSGTYVISNGNVSQTIIVK